MIGIFLIHGGGGVSSDYTASLCWKDELWGTPRYSMMMDGMGADRTKKTNHVVRALGFELGNINL